MLKTKTQMLHDKLNYNCDKISHAQTNDFLTSLDVTREVIMPKANESILKEITEQSNEKLLNSSKVFTITNGVNTLLSKHSSITFATVFKNQSLSLAQSTEDNASLSALTNHNTPASNFNNNLSNEKR
jgi:hypothetical protein